MKLFLTLALSTVMTMPAAIAAENGSIVMVYGQSDFAAGAKLGQEVDVVLQTIGPGEFAAPVVSSDALRYVGVFDVGPPNPGGARQLFRFKAVKLGTVTTTFTQVGTGRQDSFKTIVDSFEVY